ncbi:MAG: sulfatase-like hydrolase/transferase [Candidatus Sumerlaeota bacterium]|nr:sulfatase-like hydrolase/transferase [Candidatus Sumerlaeota bacterium]
MATRQTRPNQPRKPNIIILFPDQMRAQAMRCAGEKQIKTPNLDRLARQGLYLPHTYSNTPVTCAARGILLTGKHPHRSGLRINDQRLPVGQPTIATELAKQGYTTAFVGKWHLDGGIREPGYVPPERRHGFQWWAANECRHNYFDTWYFRDTPEPIKMKQYETIEWTDLAIEFLHGRRADEPFLLLVGYGPPHDPYIAPKEYMDMYPPEELKLRPNFKPGAIVGKGGPRAREITAKDVAGYYASVTCIDDNVGRIMKTLSELKMADDTIVLFTSDHGDMLGSNGLVLKRKPHEESACVPGILRWPRGIQAGQVKQELFSWVDIMPTMLGLAGAPVPAGVQGVDRSRMIVDPKARGPESVFFQLFMEYPHTLVEGPWRGVRTQRYTYARYPDKVWVLYDNQEDPYQLNNMATDPSKARLRDDLEGRVQDWMKQTGDSWALNVPKLTIMHRGPVEDHERMIAEAYVAGTPATMPPVAEGRAAKLAPIAKAESLKPTIGVFAACDPRIDEASRERARNIIGLTADVLAKRVKLPDGSPVRVVWSPVLVDGERQADIVARQFKEACVNILVAPLDTWAFPQLSLISLIQQFPEDTPLNLTCGNSGPRPGVVFTHACSGAISQYGRMVHINVGTWPDSGAYPEMTPETADALVDWCQAAVAAQGLKGRRVVVFGHDSMGMETALAHVIPTRKTYGLEITRLDMKLFADLMAKKAFDKKELKDLRAWMDKMVGERIALKDQADGKRFDFCLAMYLVMRDLLKDLNAVGGGFMNQLEWGSDRRGIPLPVPDQMESLLNSSFDHTGRKTPVPFATEADSQALLTMLFFSWLTCGNPPLFMDFRKVWEPWEAQALAKKLGLKLAGKSLWETKGFVDGDNSGSAALDWAGQPGQSAEEIMKNVLMPLAEKDYFPGGGNSVTFISPGGIEGVAGRLAYSSTTGAFSLVWDEAQTVDLPPKMADAVAHTSNWTWPHTFVTPKYANMIEYKQYAPANHFHMIQGLKPAALQFWMDLTNTLSATPWSARPKFIEGVDRPLPLLYVINGGEDATKLMRVKK